VGCFLGAIAAVVGSVLLFGNGFAGPAPIALAGGGGLIAAGTALWRPPGSRPSRGRYPSENDRG
jgi:hypothetical protein